LKNIAIIGVGEIGSRHLQSLANLEESANIYLIDSAESSLTTAKKRFNELYQENHRKIHIHTCKDLNALDHNLDIAIIATSSDVRRKVIENLLETLDVGFLILEKFLFQKIEDYDAIKMLLQFKKIPTWVNQWISSRYIFREIRTNLAPNSCLRMDVSGELWGLACNSVHFLEYFLFLCQQETFIITGSKLDEETINSKRNGFIDFTGSIYCESQRGDQLTMTSSRGDNFTSNCIIRISDGETEHEIILNADDHVIYKKTGRKASPSEKIILVLQSQITHLHIQQIFADKISSLPTYDHSLKMHLPLLKVFLKHLQNISGNEEIKCPIT